jgi:NitT/TauT family transport system substrate-binding protein
MDDAWNCGTSRRAFLTGLSALGAASLLGRAGVAHAEPPLETTRLRIAQGPFICYAPQMLAHDLLQLEGFTDVEYVDLLPTVTYAGMVAKGHADLAMFSPPAAVSAIDAGAPILMLAGIHVGCWELFGAEHIRAVRELKGKTVAVIGIGAVDQLWIASMLSYVGMDPRRDIQWISGGKPSEAMRLFVEGKADAFLGFPPQPQELRAHGIKHVLVNTTLDRPWSQYYCCMAGMPREFVRKHPVATKRALRALLKATDLCAQEPERVARYLAAKGYEPRYQIGLDVLKNLPYDRWRDSDPEDSMRFHALRLYDVGMVESTPQKIIAQGSDWRFLRELRRELKG